MKQASLFKEFLTWHLESVYRSNVFSDGYDCKRAEADGRAKLAEELFQLLEKLNE